MVFALGLSDLQRAIHNKANEIQREFVALSGELDDLSRSLLEFRGDELEKMRTEQADLRERQAELALYSPRLYALYRGKLQERLSHRGHLSPGRWLCLN